MPTTFEKISQVDKRLAGSFAVALVLSIGSFIAGQLYDVRTQPRVWVLSQAPVYDLREDVTTLDILFDGKSIRQQQQTLTLMTLKIENSGNAGINKQSSFDNEFLPGVRVDKCKIVKVDILSAGSDYLRNQFHLIQKSESEFTFGPCIIDKGDFVTLKILILHSESQHPTIATFGKIAGNPRIDVITAPDTNAATSFTKQAFSGSLPVQAARALAYTVTFIGSSFIFLWLITRTSSAVSLQQRKRHVALYKRTLDGNLKPQQDAILTLYQETNAATIVELNELFSDSESLKTKLSLWNEGPPNREDTVGRIYYHSHTTRYDPRVIRLVSEYARVEQSGSVSVDVDVVQSARNFETFLLHRVPEKVHRARRQTQTEPFGTESRSATETEGNEPIAPPANV